MGGLRRQREIALRESESRLRLALEAARMVTWDWDRASRQIVWSGNCAGLFGLDPWNFKGQLADIRKRMRLEEYVNLIRAALRTLRERADLYHEFPVLWPDGTTHWLAAEGKGVYQPGGTPWRMRGIVMDVTEKIHADLERREYAQRLRTLSHQLLNAQETERRRLAHELHDELGQSLSAIKMNLMVLRHSAAADVPTRIQDLIPIVDQTIQQTRRVALDLRPSMLDDFGLVQALRWYLDRLEKTTGLSIEYIFPDTGQRWPGPVETACFRIAQECLTNIIRHADAKKTLLQLEARPGSLMLRIQDDGRGFDVSAARQRSAAGNSLGLLGMEERAALAGGRLRIDSIPGKGTEVKVQFVLEGATATDQNKKI